jgi:hypothetical protein
MEFRDYGFGIIASTIANANRDSKKKKTPFKWYDFMPQYKEKYKRAEKKSPAELRHLFENVIVPHFNAVAEVREKAE